MVGINGHGGRVFADIINRTLSDKGFHSVLPAFDIMVNGEQTTLLQDSRGAGSHPGTIR